PVAAAMLAAELLLFEWKPRSLIPVALASSTAAVIRRYLLGLGPLFPVPAHPANISPGGLLYCALAGLLAGVLSTILTNLHYCSATHRAGRAPLPGSCGLIGWCGCLFAC